MSKNLPLLAGLLLAAPSLHADEAEDKALAAVKKWEGKVQRDEKSPAHPVLGVNLSRTQITDAGLGVVALKSLQAARTSTAAIT